MIAFLISIRALLRKNYHEKAEDLREFKIDPFVDALVEDEDHK